MPKAKEQLADWPLRPWLLAGIGAAAGLLFHFLVDHRVDQPLAIWRQAAGTFVAVSGIALLLTLERLRPLWTLVFALVAGGIMALVGWSTASYNHNGSLIEWPYLAGLFAALLATPLFQTVRDEGAWRFPYARLHGHAWSDAVIGAASLAFTGITFLLAWLIAGLFDVIGITAIRDLMRKDWFNWLLAGFAFGGCVGLLREREALLGTLQRLVMVVASVLAPVLAVALGLFLLSVPFTGLQHLWESNVPATPMFLLSGAGAILLANAVFGNGAEERSPSRVLGRSAMLLVAVVLPLAVLAALSMGIRIGQYGWTPERIWGAIAVGVALAYGLAAWWALWRGRGDYDDQLRPLQVKLALGLCGLALFLALPILDFGAISARSQLARLEQGRIDPYKFDWAAMAFDFGPSGRKRLDEIARSGSPATRKLAAAALAADQRYAASESQVVAGPPPVQLQVFGSVPVPDGLRRVLLETSTEQTAFCGQGGACRVFPQPGGEYVVFMDRCANLPRERQNDPDIACARLPGVFALRGGEWRNLYDGGWSKRPESVPPRRAAESLAAEGAALDRGDVRIVPVEKRRIEVGGEPRGDDF